jgi:hypothetical protein
MKLPVEDTQQFFKIMLGLLYYVNQKQHVIKDIASKDGFLKLPTEKKFKIREALWKTPTLIDDFVRENPEGLGDEELAITLTWKKFVSGTFFVFRQFKKYAILIKDEEVYAVVGLHSTLHEAINEFPLPAMVEAVLLPFKDQIVYDGLLKTQSIYFGGGIRASLAEVYDRAKYKDQIIATFEQGLVTKTAASKNDLRNWSVLLDQMDAQASKMKGGSDLQEAAFALLKASIGLAKSASAQPLDFNAVEASHKKIRRTYNRLDKILFYTGSE